MLKVEQERERERDIASFQPVQIRDGLVMFIVLCSCGWVNDDVI